MKGLVRLSIGVILATFFPTGLAQLELISLVRNVLDEGCDAVDLVAMIPNPAFDAGYICSAAETVAQLEDITRDIHEGLKDLTRGGVADLLQRGLNMLSTYTDVEGVAAISADLDGLLDAIDTDGLNSLSDYAAALRDAVDQVTAIARNQANNPTTPLEQAAHVVFSQAGLFDFMRSASIDSAGEITKDQLELSVQAEASRKVAEEFADNTAVEHSVARALLPVVGSSDTMKLRAQTAISTRAAMQAFTEGFADYMKQDAVIGQAVVDGLKSLAQQNAMTNAQLSAQAQYLLEEQKQRVEAQRQQLEAVVGETYDTELTSLTNLGAALRNAAENIQTGPFTINLANLGW
jgi:hypothetical protein